MKKNTALVLAGAVFLVVAILHALRMYYGLDIVVAGYTVPMWISYIGLAVALILSFLMFIARRR